MEKVKLGEIAKQIRGVSYNGDVSTDIETNEYLPILRSNNIEEGSLNFEDLVYVPKELVTENQLLQNGDILITASTGSIKVLGKNGSFDSDLKCSFGAFCKVVRATEKVEKNYLKHFFQTNYYRRTIQNITNGANINNIRNEHIDDLEIPLPSLEKQKEIAAGLDKADEIRRLNQELIEKYNQLTQSLFLDMFGDPVKNEKGWEKVELSKLTNLITDGKHGNCNDEENSGYYFISAKDIFDNKINYSNTRQIPKSEFEEVDRRTNLQKGDLVMVNTGATIGKMAIIKDIPETRRTTFQKSVAVIKPKIELINVQFLKYVFELRLDSFSGKGSGSAIKNLLLSEMRRFLIILPPLSLQNEFASRVSAIEAQKQLAENALAKSEELFQSLLQDCFRHCERSEATSQ